MPVDDPDRLWTDERDDALVKLFAQWVAYHGGDEDEWRKQEVGRFLTLGDLYDLHNEWQATVGELMRARMLHADRLKNLAVTADVARTAHRQLADARAEIERVRSLAMGYIRESAALLNTLTAMEKQRDEAKQALGTAEADILERVRARETAMGAEMTRLEALLADPSDAVKLQLAKAAKAAWDSQPSFWVGDRWLGVIRAILVELKSLNADKD